MHAEEEFGNGSSNAVQGFDCLPLLSFFLCFLFSLLPESAKDGNID